MVFRNKSLGLGFQVSLWLCMRNVGQPWAWCKPRKNAAFYPSLKWRSWFSFKWTWGCGRAMGTDNAMQGLNHDEMDITKVPSLPSRLEIKDQDYFLYEERALHLNVCHANKNLRIWIKIWPCQLQQMNLNFMKPLLLTKAFLTRAIWSQYLW